jgi:hypothetical protein
MSSFVTFLFVKNNYNDQAEDSEMGRAYSTNEGEESI